MSRIKPTKPKIYTRSSWGAQRGGGTRYWEPLRDVYFEGVLHHSAMKADRSMSLAEAKAAMRTFQNVHFNRGFSDIGYHYVIAPGGQIFAGRPIDTQGAHVELANTGRVGICLMGELHKHEPTSQQISALYQLWAWLCWELDLDAKSLYGHQDYLATDCPGSAQKRLPQIRNFVAKMLNGEEAEAPQPIAPSFVLNGKKIGEAVLIDGRAYVPLRVAGEALGYKVDWDKATKTASLTSE